MCFVLILSTSAVTVFQLYLKYAAFARVSVCHLKQEFCLLFTTLGTFDYKRGIIIYLQDLLCFNFKNVLKQSVAIIIL